MNQPILTKESFPATNPFPPETPIPGTKENWEYMASVWETPWEKRTLKQRQQTMYGMCYFLHTLDFKDTTFMDLFSVKFNFPIYEFWFPIRDWYWMVTEKDIEQADANRAIICRVIAGWFPVDKN